MRIKDVKYIILGGLAVFAEENGFKVNKGAFCLKSKIKDPYSEIYFLYNTWGFEVEIFPYVSVDFKEIRDICEKCGFHNLNSCAFLNLFVLEQFVAHGYSPKLKFQIELDNADKLKLTDGEAWEEPCIERIKSLLPYAVDYIKNLSTIEAIDRLYNTPPIHDFNRNCLGIHIHCLVGIISAKLVHNPQYDKLKAMYTKIVKKELHKELREVFFRVVDYLDTYC